MSTVDHEIRVGAVYLVGSLLTPFEILSVRRCSTGVIVAVNARPIASVGVLQVDPINRYANQPGETVELSPDQPYRRYAADLAAGRRRLAREVLAAKHRRDAEKARLADANGVRIALERACADAGIIAVTVEVDGDPPAPTIRVHLTVDAAIQLGIVTVLGGHVRKSLQAQAAS